MDGFKDNLRQARILKGMTQAEVAKEIGIAKSSYSLYESGKREPNVITIKKISRVLEVPADILLGTQNLWLTAEDNILLLNYKKLNDAGRRKVRDYVDDIFDKYKR